MKLDSIFENYKDKIRTEDNYISAYDFITMIKPEVKASRIFYNFLNCGGKGEYYTTEDWTHMMDIESIVNLLMSFDCERSVLFRKTCGEDFIRNFGGNDELVNKIKVEQKLGVSLTEPHGTLSVSGVTSEIQNQILTEIRSTFTQQEQELYINSLMLYMNYHQTNDYVVNLEHVYQMIGFSRLDKAKRTLVENFIENEDYRVQEGYEVNPAPLNGGAAFPEVKHNLGGEEVNKAPAIAGALNTEVKRNLGGAGKNKQTILLNIDTFKNLCMISRTEKAKELRKYFVKVESVVHSVVSKTVNIPRQITFTPEQINNSNRLINHFGPQKDIFYMFSFKHLEDMYAKFGIVGNLREFHNRVDEHKSEFGEICFHYSVKCRDVALVESEFKNTSIYKMNKSKIPKKYGTGFHVEIIKLSEVITTDIVREEMNKIADDRILDPPPNYSVAQETTSSLALDIEKERTKQIEVQEKTKQMELEIRLLELKIKNGLI
jgi:hypothetical protein